MDMPNNRIRELREGRGLRQTDVASATGIDQKTLSNYERGKTNPDSYSIIRLADFFDVTTDYLLGYSGASLASEGDIVAKLCAVENDIREIKRFFGN